jgi:hypothetical protein
MWVGERLSPTGDCKRERACEPESGKSDRLAAHWRSELMARELAARKMQRRREM